MLSSRAEDAIASLKLKPSFSGFVRSAVPDLLQGFDMAVSSQLLGVLLLVVPLSLQQSSLHEHGHSHDPEPPHYKYSRAANEKVMVSLRR